MAPKLVSYFYAEPSADRFAADMTSPEEVKEILKLIGEEEGGSHKKPETRIKRLKSKMVGLYRDHPPVWRRLELVDKYEQKKKRGE